MKKTRSIVLATALVFLATTAAAAVFNWQNVNERPYRGTTEAALKALVPRGLPQAAATDIAERARRGQFTTGTLYKGEQCRAMVFGIGAVEENVVMDWRHFAALETEDYDAGEWLVRRVTVCNNWLLCKKPAAKPAAVSAPPAPAPTPETVAVQPVPPAPTPVSPPREVLALAEPEEAVTYNIWLWRYGPLTARFGRFSGHQSRDLGDLVLKEYFIGVSKKVPDAPKLDDSGCRRFLVVFKNFDYEAIRRDGIEISNQAGRHFSNFGAMEGGRVVNTVEVMVCSGRGFFRIKGNWIKTNSGLVVHAPIGPVFHYPTSGRLTTCTGEPDDEGRCGMKWPGPGEVYRNVVGIRRGEVKQGNIDAHFVLAE